MQSIKSYLGLSTLKSRLPRRHGNMFPLQRDLETDHSWLLSIQVTALCRELTLYSPAHYQDRHPFLQFPLFGPLLFNNQPPSSNARDHAANERTFLSLLRLSIYLAIVSLAILTSYHLKNQPTTFERRIALPLGVIFFALSLATLMAGWMNYVRTVVRYARKVALVQRGAFTEILYVLVGVAIVAACIMFLGAEAGGRG